MPNRPIRKRRLLRKPGSATTNMFQADAALFRSINNLVGKSPVLDAIGTFCARWLIFVMFAAVVVRILYALRNAETRELAAALTTAELRACVATFLAFLLNVISSHVMTRSRP